MNSRLPPRSDLLGAHVSIAGGIWRAPARAAALSARVFQVFTKNQNQWRGKSLTDDEVGRWFAELDGHGLKAAHVCSHDSYLINLASPDPALRQRSRAAFRDEIERAARLAIPSLVLHPGSHVGSGESTGLATIAANLDRCLEEVAAGSVPKTESVQLCLETTAGQGTNLGYRFEQLRDIIAASRYPERLGICLDTCHVFAAGYQLATASQWRRTLARLDACVGLERVRVIHLNDAKRSLGSRVDRHERIGRGAIGLAPFRHILRTRRLQRAIKILEVPGGEEAYGDDLELLRTLIAPGAAP
jgi:deoxyribonuclease-4